MPETGDVGDIAKPEIPNIRETRSPRQPHQVSNPPDTSIENVRREIDEHTTEPRQARNLNLRFVQPAALPEKPKGLAGKVSGAVRRVISGFRDTFERIGKIPIEEMDERTIAFLIMTEQTNRIRFSPDDQISPFNTVDILRDAGYVLLDPTNADYEGKWPTQYTRIHQVLRSLSDNGLIEYLDPETAESEYDPGYVVKPEQVLLLHDLAARAKEVSSRYNPKAMAPITR